MAADDHVARSARQDPGQTASALAVALAAPIVIATLLLAVIVIAEIGGWSILSEGGARNIAEAAGMASASEVVRRLDQGEDAGRVYDVRQYILSSSFTRVTALEAAVGTRRVELVRLLDRRGLIRTRTTRNHLACLASDLMVKDIVDYLAPRGVQCLIGATLSAVAARGQS